MTEETKEHKVEREGWGEGPWSNEPDKGLWEHAGFDCMIVRNRLGALCGYVGVHKGHPWFGAVYDDVEADVHGGLTYSDYCAGPICHPKPEKTYWLGFDCAHAGDFAPMMARHAVPFADEVYRDWAYVKREVERLAEQAKAAQKM
jgi:hypothetical protein